MDWLKSACFILMLLAFGSALACPVGGTQNGQSVGYGITGVEEPSVVVIRSLEDWQSVWQQMGREPELPFDPEHQDAVAVFLGTRNTGGFHVELVNSSVSQSDRVVQWREIKPAPTSAVTMVITSPALISTFPKVPGDIKVEEIPAQSHPKSHGLE